MSCCRCVHCSRLLLVDACLAFCARVYTCAWMRMRVTRSECKPRSVVQCAARAFNCSCACASLLGWTKSLSSTSHAANHSNRRVHTFLFKIGVQRLDAAKNEGNMRNQPIFDALSALPVNLVEDRSSMGTENLHTQQCHRLLRRRYTTRSEE